MQNGTFYARFSPDFDVVLAENDVEKTPVDLNTSICLLLLINRITKRWATSYSSLSVAAQTKRFSMFFASFATVHNLKYLYLKNYLRYLHNFCFVLLGI